MHDFRVVFGFLYHPLVPAKAGWVKANATGQCDRPGLEHAVEVGAAPGPLADAHGRLWRQVARASGGAADKTGLLTLVLVAEWTARRMLNLF